MKSIVMAVFRPEAQLTLFLHMRTIEIAKNIAKTYCNTQAICVTGIRVHQCEWRGQIFDQGPNLQRIESFS